MNVDGVSNGIVLDHIRAGYGMEIYNYLKLGQLNCCIAVLQNVPSKKFGRKDIIKIDSVIDLNLDVLGYLDHNITVNYIKDGILSKKCHLELPEKLFNVISCKNPRCISSVEQGITQIFELADRDQGIYRCKYCDVKHP